MASLKHVNCDFDEENQLEMPTRLP